MVRLINFDALNDKWLKSDYHLLSLSKMVQSSCNLGNFAQLVSVPTRFQFNSVKNTTDISCIDHVYTNAKYRCSGITVIPFGGSDHDILQYIRYSKTSPTPAKTIRRRSYKNFLPEEFLSDLAKVDWEEVYSSQDVDLAAEIFTRKFVQVLNPHAPWILYQQ